MILSLFFTIFLFFGMCAEICYCNQFNPTPERKRFLATWAILMIATTVLFLTGCTPRTNLAHQYHVAAITINGEVTETDFLLGEK